MRGKLEAGYKLEVRNKLESWGAGQLEPAPHELKIYQLSCELKII